MMRARYNSSRPEEESVTRRHATCCEIGSLIGEVTRGERNRIKEFGNGTRARGHLITLKNHQHHSTDGECDTARRSIRDGNWT